MSDRYAYYEHDGFFVDMSKTNEDGEGEELLTEEVLALLNVGEATKAREEAEAEKMERAIALLESWVDMSMDHSSLTERGVTKQAQRGEATAKFLAELAASGTAEGPVEETASSHAPA